jgi:hypothetical protein
LLKPLMEVFPEEIIILKLILDEVYEGEFTITKF